MKMSTVLHVWEVSVWKIAGDTVVTL